MYSVHIWRKGHLPLFRLSEIEGGERNYDVIEILLIKRSLVSRFNRFNRSVYNVIFRIRPYCHKFQMSFKTMLYAIFHRFYFHQ